MAYDGAHRLSTKTLSTGEIVNYCYDGKLYTAGGCTTPTQARTEPDYPKGRLTGVGSSGGWTNHLRIDEFGRTTLLEQKSADLAVKTLAYEYATNGFVKKMTYPSGREVSYQQSQAGRTLQATAGAVEYAKSLSYSSTGGMLAGYWNGGLGSPVALREERTYNVLGQMLTQALRKGGTDLKWRITNEYGLSGNLSGNNGNLNKQQTETGTATYGVRYVYDGANRIRGAAENAPGEANLASQTCATVGGTWCVKYAINGYGNAWTENKSPTAGGLTPLAETSFEAFTNRLLGASYYANGFQKSLVLNDNKSRAEYDSDGRLRKAGRVTDPNGMVWDASQLLTENTYNGAGQRVKRTVTQGPATSTTHYVYGLDGEVASEWESSSTAVTGRQFLVGDHLGSTRVRFDASGEVLQRIDYEPYGGEVQRTGVSGYSGANEVKQKFTGKERNPELQADYFGSRYLGMGLGRFTTPDGPLVDQQVEDPRSWNLYSYVRNNPLIFTDPSGNCSQKAPGEPYTDDPDQPCTAPGATSITVTEEEEAPLSPYAQEFVRQLGMRSGASEQMIAVVAGSSTVAGAASASSVVVVVIDGVAYTWEALVALGPEVLARLVAAGKITQALWAKLQPYLGGGAEISFGKGKAIERINLFGDWRQIPGRVYSWVERLPHYHRRFPGPGGGIGRHRPWDAPGVDKSGNPLSWWKRF